MRLSWLLLFAVVVLAVSAAVTPNSKNNKIRTTRPTVAGKKTTKPKSTGGAENKSAGQCSSGATKTETYTVADETKILLNPEKGFYQDYAYPKDGKNPSWNDWKKNDKTLVLAQYMLSSSADNSAIFKATEKHLSDAKKAGIKVILRYKYTDNEQGTGDASFDKIIKDIGSIKSLLQKPEASDAFLTLQVGLVGAYGEWAYSNTLGFQQDLKNPNFFSKKEGGVVDTKKTEQRYTIAKTAFEALPAQRQIQMRQMNFRQTLCDRNKVCERVGIFNDCFMGGVGNGITKEESASNSGTFNTPEETAKLTKDGKKVLVGGEFCTKTDGVALADYPTQKTFENVKNDIRAQRFTFLNSGVLPKIMYSDSNKPTRNKVNNFLGYRFELVSGIFPKQIQTGGTYCATITVRNTGATNLIYKRPVEVVLRGKDNKEITFPVNGVDLTSWDADAKEQSVKLTFSATSVPAGEYDVLLSLPDNSKTNKKVVEYRILMSNGYIASSKSPVNELPSRYNKLTTVTITA